MPNGRTVRSNRSIPWSFSTRCGPDLRRDAAAGGDEGTVRNKAVYVALGVRIDDQKEVLGLWIEQTEGAKFWLRVMTELKNRGLEDVLIAVVDGLKGFPRRDHRRVSGSPGSAPVSFT